MKRVLGTIFSSSFFSFSSSLSSSSNKPFLDNSITNYIPITEKERYTHTHTPIKMPQEMCCKTCDAALAAGSFPADETVEGTMRIPREACRPRPHALTAKNEVVLGIPRVSLFCAGCGALLGCANEKHFVLLSQALVFKDMKPEPKSEPKPKSEPEPEPKPEKTEKSQSFVASVAAGALLALPVAIALVSHFRRH